MATETRDKYHAGMGRTDIRIVAPGWVACRRGYSVEVVSDTSTRGDQVDGLYIAAHLAASDLGGQLPYADVDGAWTNEVRVVVEEGDIDEVERALEDCPVFTGRCGRP